MQLYCHLYRYNCAVYTCVNIEYFFWLSLKRYPVGLEFLSLQIHLCYHGVIINIFFNLEQIKFHLSLMSRESILWHNMLGIVRELIHTINDNFYHTSKLPHFKFTWNFNVNFLWSLLEFHVKCCFHVKFAYFFFTWMTRKDEFTWNSYGKYHVKFTWMSV